MSEFSEFFDQSLLEFYLIMLLESTILYITNHLKRLHMSDPTYPVNTPYVEKLSNVKEAVTESYLNNTPLSKSDCDIVLEIVNGKINGITKKKDKKPAILNLDENTTRKEMNKARKKQAVRQGSAVYLPLWKEGLFIAPSSFLRSALFSTGEGVQNSKESSGVGKINESFNEVKLASLHNITVILTGTHLCQKDRQVYSTCLDYYRERPLAAVGSNDFVKTTFYEFCKRMGGSYGVNPHNSLLASLLRLQCARLRVRHDGRNFNGSILGVKLGDSNEERKGGDELCIQITENIAELFGVGAWTAVDMKTASYRGILGWTANFYASHSARGYWYGLDILQALAGYPGTKYNFKPGFRKALDELKKDTVAEDYRVCSYQYSEDNKKILVHKSDKTSSAKKKKT